jgi:hypothetical protein
MKSKAAHAWYFEAPKRQRNAIESLPRIKASREKPISVSLETFIQAYHILTDDEKKYVLGQFAYDEWKSPILLQQYSFPDTTMLVPPTFDQRIRSVLLVLDSYYGKNVRLSMVLQLENMMIGVDMTPQRVASIVELYLLDGQFQKAIDMLSAHENVSKISRKRLEHACKADATFMLPALPLFVQKRVTLAKDALSLCMKLQTKNEVVAIQLITNASIEDPLVFFTDALSYKMFALAEAIIALPSAGEKTYAIESQAIVKLLKYPQCDSLVRALCTMPCFTQSRHTIALALFKVPRFKVSANALIPLGHPKWLEYMTTTNQLSSVDIATFVQNANALTGSIPDNVPDELVRIALQNGLRQHKVQMEQVFRCKPLNEIDYAMLVQTKGTNAVLDFVKTDESWVGFMRASIDLTPHVLETMRAKMPIKLFTSDLIRACAMHVSSYDWTTVIIRASHEPLETLDAFIQHYPSDLDISYTIARLLSRYENTSIPGLTRLVHGGVLHASMFKNVSDVGWEPHHEELVVWSIEVLGLSKFDVFECINKSGAYSMVADLKQTYIELGNDDLLEHRDLIPERFKHPCESYIVDLWHVSQCATKPKHSLNLRNHYTWFNPSFREASQRVGNGSMTQMSGTYMGNEDESDIFWVKRIRVNIKPLVWFEHTRASKLDKDRRTVLSEAFARFNMGGSALSYVEYDDETVVAQRAKAYMTDDALLESRMHKNDASEFDCLRVDQNFINAESGIHDILQLSDYDAVLSYDVTDGEPDTKSIILFDVPSVLVHEWDWTLIG